MIPGIIIEGLDGSGKSTLAKRLMADLKIPLFHYDGIPETRKEFDERCKLALKAIGIPSIQDRCPFISEAIYGPYNRQGGGFVTINQISEWLYELQPMIVWCDTQNIMHRPKPGENPKILERIEKHQTDIYRMYNRLWGEADVLAYRYDWTMFDAYGKLRELLERVR